MTPKTVIQLLDSTASDVFTITPRNMPDLPRAIELAVLPPDRFYLDAQGSLGLCPSQAKPSQAKPSQGPGRERKTALSS
jgi:hypothetical protein